MAPAIKLLALHNGLSGSISKDLVAPPLRNIQHHTNHEKNPVKPDKHQLPRLICTQLINKARDGNRTCDPLLGKEEKWVEYRLVMWCKGAWNVGFGIFLLNRFL